MRVYPPTITEAENIVCISARVKIKGATKHLWYKFPGCYAPYITGRTDAFAIPLLPLAMRLGESLEVLGSLSSRLAKGMREYQRIQAVWQPEFFKEVPLEFETLESRTPPSPKSVAGSAFSGGVDSFFTLWSHLPKNEPDPYYQISSCLMINGFDGDADIDAQIGSYHLLKTYEQMMERSGIRLIVSTTNVLEFISPWILKQSFGAIITASALALGNYFHCFYIPSSYKFNDFYPDGSHLLLDNLLSNDTTQILHDGSHLTRVRKTETISAWPETFGRLRVCFGKTRHTDTPEMIENCCRCDKCLRTMVTLDLVNRLSDYSAFPLPIDRASLRRMDWIYPGLRIFAKEILQLAINKRRIDIIFDLSQAFARSQFIRIKLALASVKHLISKHYGRIRHWRHTRVILKHWQKTDDKEAYFKRGDWTPVRSSDWQLQDMDGHLVIGDVTKTMAVHLTLMDSLVWHFSNGKHQIKDIDRMIRGHVPSITDKGLHDISKSFKKLLEKGCLKIT